MCSTKDVSLCLKVGYLNWWWEKPVAQLFVIVVLVRILVLRICSNRIFGLWDIQYNVVTPPPPRRIECV
jgi:hypothetical protein